MRRRGIDAVFRRKSLLMAAGIFFLIAVLSKPWILLSFLSAKGLTSMALIVVAALFAAIAVHELAQIVLRGPGEPWYARTGALLFLPVALLSINMLFNLVDNCLHKTFGIGPLLSSTALGYMFVAVELLWISLLERPAKGA